MSGGVRVESDIFRLDHQGTWGTGGTRRSLGWGFSPCVGCSWRLSVPPGHLRHDGQVVDEASFVLRGGFFLHKNEDIEVHHV